MTALGQAAAAYEFNPPAEPQLPTDLPDRILTVDSSTSSHGLESESPPTAGYWWYGPTENTASGNDVHVSKSADSPVFGGWSNGAEAVANNRVVIEQPGKMMWVYGGYAVNGNAQKNYVDISGKTSSSNDPLVYGGYSKAGGDAAENMIFIRSGAEIYGTVAGGHAQLGDASKNVVVLESGAAAHTSTIAGGTGLNADDNQVFILGKAEKNVYGGNSSNANGHTDGNLVYVGPNGDIEWDAFAGYTSSSPAPSASDNVLVVDSGTVHRNAAAASNNTDGLGNELHLLGNAVVEQRAGANLSGFQTNEGRGLDGLVHIRGTVTVGALEGFDQLVLELGDENVDKALLTITNAQTVLENEAILDLTGVNTLIAAESITNPKSGALLFAVAPAAGAQDSITLLLDDATTFTDETGVFVDVDWLIPQEVVDAGEIAFDKAFINEKGEIIASLGGVETVLGDKEIKAAPESKTLSESFLGTIAFVSQGAEFIADEGMRAMTEAAADGRIAVFGAVHGGSSRYETGSHVDVDGASIATGVVSQVGRMTLAGFVEAGTGSSESSADGAKGDGDHTYYGLGAAARWHFESPFYIDGSARAGWAGTEFDGRYADASAKYDASGLYASIHAGAGWTFALTDRLALDVYGRYVGTWLEGDDVGLGTPDREKFSTDDVWAHAFRAGARLEGAVSENFGWRFGLAFEHVADGEADSEIAVEDVRLKLDAPTLEGNAGIIEAGLTMTPSAGSPWSADVGLKGYVGDREGVSGSVRVMYAF